MTLALPTPMLAPPPSPEVIALADATVAVLHTRGWHQGSYEGADGTVCLTAAMMIAAFGAIEVTDEDWCATGKPYTGLRRLIETVIHRRGFRYRARNEIPVWNDQVADSVEDVILLVKEAVS